MTSSTILSSNPNSNQHENSSNNLNLPPMIDTKFDIKSGICSPKPSLISLPPNPPSPDIKIKTDDKERKNKINKTPPNCSSSSSSSQSIIPSPTQLTLTNGHLPAIVQNNNNNIHNKNKQLLRHCGESDHVNHFPHFCNIQQQETKKCNNNNNNKEQQEKTKQQQASIITAQINNNNNINKTIFAPITLNIRDSQNAVPQSASCHQCKTKKDISILFYCTKKKPCVNNAYKTKVIVMYLPHITYTHILPSIYLYVNHLQIY